MSSLLRAFAFLLPLGLTLAAPASAETRTLTYQLLAENRSMGSREAKLNYLAGERGEIVTLQAWTELGINLGAVTYQYKQRLGGRFGGNRSFSSSMSENGKVREVQGQLDAAGNWDITIVENGGARHWVLPPDAVDITSAELLDTDRVLRTLEQVGTLRVLATESGAVLSGPVETLGLGDVTLGKQKVQVRKFRWSPPEGAMTLSFNQEGILVAYEMTVAGRPVSARLTAAPAPRTFEETFSLPLTGNPVGEEGVR